MKTDLKLQKRPSNKQVLPASCLNCGSEQGYQAQTATNTVEFRGEGFVISYERMLCPDCGASMLTNEQLKARIKKTVAAYQKSHGLLTAEDLIRQRTALGYSKRLAFLKAAPELAEATIKRLEAGQRVQDKSTDLAIRAVLQKLEHQQMLDLLKEPMPEAELASMAQAKTGFSGWDMEPLARAACIATAATISCIAFPQKRSGGQVASADYDNTNEKVVTC
jgi:hypothetical protein